MKRTHAELKSSMLEAIRPWLTASAASLTVLWYGASEVLAGHLSLGR
ncbi:MAG: hypothetical protein U1E76_02935 [Planctomycetota bacterium]